MTPAQKLSEEIRLDREYAQACLQAASGMEDIKSAPGLLKAIVRSAKKPAMKEIAANPDFVARMNPSRAAAELNARDRILAEYQARKAEPLGSDWGPGFIRKAEWYGLDLAVRILASAYEEEGKE